MKALIQHTAGIVRCGLELLQHTDDYDHQVSWSSTDPNDVIVHALVARTEFKPEHHDAIIAALKAEGHFRRVGFVRYRHGRKKEYWH